VPYEHGDHGGYAQYDPLGQHVDAYDQYGVHSSYADHEKIVCDGRVCVPWLLSYSILSKLLPQLSIWSPK
jgi:hypothetical protein